MSDSPSSCAGPSEHTAGRRVRARILSDPSPAPAARHTSPGRVPDALKRLGPEGRAWIARIAVAAFMAVLLAAVYDASVPDRFNTVYANKRFFDSDGEFITRQFRLGSTYTHNDHLLYHIVARALYNGPAGFTLGPARDPVSLHKILSVIAGAAGVALLFLIGCRITRDGPGSWALAMAVGGSAGYWFFSATIDTYLPHIVWAIAALGLALDAWMRPRTWTFAALGAVMGIAFLFRTDGFLLASLGVVALSEPRRAPARLLVCGAAGLLTGVLGYAWLAHVFYDVPLARVHAWALSHAVRPEAAKYQWAALDNLRGDYAVRVLLNHVLYTVLIPGLEATRSADVVRLFGELRGGLPALAMYAGCWIAWGLFVGRRFAARRFENPALARLLAGLGLLWFLPRAVLYCWWDPRDAFLFAVLNSPALWLAALIALLPTAGAATGARWGVRLVLFGAAALVWSHNGLHLIRPLGALP